MNLDGKDYLFSLASNLGTGKLQSMGQIQPH